MPDNSHSDWGRILGAGQTKCLADVKKNWGGWRRLQRCSGVNLGHRQAQTHVRNKLGRSLPNVNPWGCPVILTLRFFVLGSYKIFGLYTKYSVRLAFSFWAEHYWSRIFEPWSNTSFHSSA